MVVTADSHMGMFLPGDISCRILTLWTASRIPFIKQNVKSLQHFTFSEKNMESGKRLSCSLLLNLTKRTMEQLNRRILRTVSFLCQLNWTQSSFGKIISEGGRDLDKNQKSVPHGSGLQENKSQGIQPFFRLFCSTYCILQTKLLL